MKTRNFLKGLTVAVMIIMGLCFMIFPYYITERDIIISGFLFLCLGLRSIFYTLDSNPKIWRYLDKLIEKNLDKENL